jgi:hypothetical protein
MKTDVQLWSYVAQFLLEWEMFQTNVAEKITIHFLFNEYFPIIMLLMKYSDTSANEWPC